MLDLTSYINNKARFVRNRIIQTKMFIANCFRSCVQLTQHEFLLVNVES